MKTLPLIMLLVACPQLYADDHGDARRLREAGDVVPLAQIIQQLPASSRERVIEVDLEQEGNRRIYEIEALDEHGQVWEYRFDASNGAALGRKQED